MKILTPVLDRVMTLVTWFLILVLAVMTTMLFISVIGRYFFRFPFPWSDPVARYGQTWIMLLGSVVVLRKGLHIGIDNFINLVREPYRTWILRFNMLLILIFAIAMTSQGLRLVQIAANQIIPELGIRMVWVYYMIPVTGVLMALTSIEMIFKSHIDGLTAAE